MVMVGCSFDTSGVGFGWGGTTLDQGAGIKEGGSKPKADKYTPPLKKDIGTKPKADKFIQPPPKKDKGAPPKPDQSVPPPHKDVGIKPALDKGPPPPPDQGVLQKDTQPVSWYGRYCEAKFIGQQCPDGKTKCVASPLGSGGICTHGCYPLMPPCPQGPAGSKASCGQWTGVTGYHCLFLCKYGSQNWPCPNAKLTCTKYNSSQSHCWP